MTSLSLHYRPTLDPAEIGDRLDRLLVPGRISDVDLDCRIARIGERFRVFTGSSPFGIVAPGHVVSRELRLSAEAYLPMEEIRRAFSRLLSLSLTYTPPLPPPLLHDASCWFDVAHGLHPLVTTVSPAVILREMSNNEDFRCRVLFSLFIPRRYGGTFNRYPGQTEFLRSELSKRAGKPGSIRCLDAACGCGEGTYGLARLLVEAGYPPGSILIHGATIDPLELLAAAHGWFPHDPARQRAFRRQIAPLIENGALEHLLFFQEDLTGGKEFYNGGYDLILCNGLLGGPLVNDLDTLERIVGRLCARLRPGGMLLAADRFHGGWKKAAPDARLNNLMARHGLRIVADAEGVAGIKTGTRDWGPES